MLCTGDDDVLGRRKRQPQRLPAEDERVDVIFSAVLINLVRRLAPGLLAAALMSPGVCGAAEHGTGKVTAASGIAGAVALQPDGRIVVAGSSGTQTLLARFQPDGTPDPTFGTEGVVTSELGSYAFTSGIALQADGRILLTAEAYVGANVHILTRYGADGTLDRTFGSSGIVGESIGPYGDRGIAGVSLAPDGRIVAAGTAIVGFEAVAPGLAIEFSGFWVARYDASGKRDSAFGADGAVVTTFAKPGPNALAVAVGQNDSVTVAGATYFDSAALARYTVDGVLDPLFGTNGVVVRECGTGTAAALALTSDGRMVIAGSTGHCDSDPTRHDFAVARLQRDGTPDPTFNGGRPMTATPGARSEPHDAGASAVALQPDGKIVVAGSSGNGTAPPHAFLLARYLDDGTLDTTFGGGKGFVSAEFGRPVAVAADVGLQSDGAIVVVGTAFDSVNKDGAVLALARWSARGTLDADFGHELCGDCADNNADGLVDAEDPECCGQRISGDLVLRRVRIRGHGSVSAVHLDARLPEESAIDPLHEDVAIQLRQEDGPRLLCARLPATRFVARRARFVFADRSMHVPGAKGITSLAFRRIRPGLARVRGAGRAVAFPAPQAAAIRMTLGFMDPSDPARNSCATTVGSFRRQRQSIVYP